MATIIMVERRVGGIHVPSYQIEDFSMDRWLVVMFFGIISPNRMVVWQVRSNEAEFSLYLTKILFLLFL